ncbi:MAG: hypothetical protein WBC91_18060 [Phototrophicaceae bacterium]
MAYRKRQGGGPPAWLTFLLGIAFVFGGTYLWSNLQSFVRNGGISVSEATAVSQGLSTTSAIRQVTDVAGLPTRRPTATPKPSCQFFEVSTATAIMRQAASTSSRLLESLPQGTVICVLDTVQADDGFIWYFVDRDEITNFIEPGYMREDLVRALNPTPTPSNTAPPPPTITLTYTPTATITPLPTTTDG